MDNYSIEVNGKGVEVLVLRREDGSALWIPMDENNSDYQAYLNKDKAEQSTPIVTADE